MNSTELYIEAGEKLRDYQKTHTGPLQLCIVNGKVKCVCVKDKSRYALGVLYISNYELISGLTGPRWNAIGKALLELFVKEQKCQTHLKH